MTNARENERVTINKEFDSFAQFMEEYVTNISRTGAFVKTSTPLPVGTEVDLRFTVVMDGIETIEGVGEVVRVETDPAGMGVVFKQLSGYSVLVNAHPAVVDLMQGEEKAAVVEAEKRYMRRIEFNPRREYHIEQFDLQGK